MFDVRMIILRVASAAALVYGATEFLKDPKNIEDVLSGSADVWNDLYEWSQNKMMGVADNSTTIQVKKSARQIYAEAFMDEESVFTRSSHFVEFADDEALKAEFEKRKQKAAAEALDELDVDSADSNREERSEGLGADDANEDPLDQLTRTEDEL